MKTLTATQLVACFAGAVGYVWSGDNFTTSAATASHVGGMLESPAFDFDFEPVGGLPSNDQILVLAKWSPTELSSFADFFLHSPRSPRHVLKRKFSFHRSSSNFSESDD
ncbi:Aste57867_9509 [Aphanomyces stellatus]|uniref:Aste57867_9509 protein n=1 Tax=Aphanomyces stellatus TaxID=120398 RepID=A0A485KNC8_9STRA|nr:hypothetical protein As57867_009472 [Aphanomyces stellatus]VFT86388.1 Aste57867_9509 [Aphanomyces stellatus]